MDLSVRTDPLGLEDQSWLDSARGTSQAQSITLAVSAFTAGTHYPNGYFPSGIPLGKYTSGANTGLYGPYTAGATDGTQNLAGFLFTYTQAPRVAGTNVQGALLDTGRVITAFLPITVNAAAQATNPRFVFV